MGLGHYSRFVRHIDSLCACFLLVTPYIVDPIFKNLHLGWSGGILHSQIWKHQGFYLHLFTFLTIDKQYPYPKALAIPQLLFIHSLKITFLLLESGKVSLFTAVESTIVD